MLTFVPTMDELRRMLGQPVHTLSASETAAWNASDPEARAEARRAIRDAVRDAGGGEIRDGRGRVLDRVG